MNKDLSKFIGSNKDMSNGFRCLDRTPLNAEEIEFLKNEIISIEADEHIFIFNDINHIKGSTCYNFEKDKIYVTRNVFPDENTESTHPRDLLTPRAVLAHEYYGHRFERKRYLKEESGEIKELPVWKDEAYASINAAFKTPNLTQQERATLLNDAFYRAREANQEIILTKNMKEILYGEWYFTPEKRIEGTIIFIGGSSGKGDEGNGGS